MTDAEKVKQALARKDVGHVAKRLRERAADLRKQADGLDMLAEQLEDTLK